MIETNDLLSLLLSAYKDYVQNIEIENVKEEFIKLQITEAETRREKKNALIRQMAKLKNEYSKFQTSYKRIVKKTGVTIPAIDEYLKSIEKYIKLLSIEKNRHIE